MHSVICRIQQIKCICDENNISLCIYYKAYVQGWVSAAERVLFSKLCGLVAENKVAVVLQILLVELRYQRAGAESHLSAEEEVFQGLL